MVESAASNGGSGNTGSVVSHLECRSCDNTEPLDTRHLPCRDCGGILDPQYEYSALEIDRSTWDGRNGSMWDYRELLPIQNSASIISMEEGRTPLVGCSHLAEQFDIGRLLLKDEGRNPTNTFKDRGQSVAISAAIEHGATAVGLPSAGNAGQSASAYAARAQLPCHVFLNHQAGQLKKDLVRAHGAELHLIEGKIGDAGSAFDKFREREEVYSVSTFQTPFRHEGKKTMGYEIFDSLDWEAPDHIVYPTGGGVGLIGIWKAYQELTRLGWLESTSPPALHVAQSSGSAPVVRALNDGASEHTAWDSPESIAKGVEIPDPGASPWIIEAVTQTGGQGIAVDDDEAVQAAIDMARADGLEMCITAAVALAGTRKLAEQGVFAADDEVVVINTGAGCKTATVLGDAARGRVKLE